MTTMNERTNEREIENEVTGEEEYTNGSTNSGPQLQNQHDEQWQQQHSTNFFHTRLSGSALITLHLLPTSPTLDNHCFNHRCDQHEIAGSIAQHFSLAASAVDLEAVSAAAVTPDSFPCSLQMTR